MTEKRLFKLRKKIAKKRPKFIRHESDRLVRVKSSWRKPRGIDNKVRMKRAGYKKQPGVGYRNPRAVRYLHPSGLREHIVYNVKDLEKLDADRDVARIASSVGRKKRMEIIDRAESLMIRIVNPGELIEESEEL